MPNIETLRTPLANQYPNKGDREIIVLDAGLDRTSLDINDPAIDAWNNIIVQANTEGKLSDVLKIAIESTNMKERIAVYNDFLNRIVDLNTIVNDADSFIEVIEKLRKGFNCTRIGERKGDKSIEVFSLSDDVDEGHLVILLRSEPNRKYPLKGEEPYSIKDKDYFFGYERQVKNFADRITESRKNLVLIQEQGVGKTSFIDAGVIPELLNRDRNCLIIKIRIYENLENQLKDFVKSQTKEFTQNLISTHQNNDRPVVIIFDQIDTSITDQQKETFFKILKKLKQTDFRTVLICRNDDGNFQSELHEIDNSLEFERDLLNFDSTRAKKILERFLNDDDEKEKVIGKILADFKELEEGDEKISLQLFQVFCYSLHKKVTDKIGNFSVSLNFYKQNQVKILLTKHFEDKKSILGSGYFRDIALQILASFSLIENENGRTIDEIRKEMLKKLKPEPDEIEVSFSNEELLTILEKLQSLKLIVKQRVVDKKEKVDKFKPALKFYIDAAADEVKSDTFLANQFFNLLWLLWKRITSLVSTSQLKNLYADKDKLDLNAVQSLFLLRSAVENNEPIDFWLESVERDNGKKLVEELQKFRSSQQASPNSEINDFEFAIKVFGETSESDAENQDWLTRKAVSDEKLEIRQTAVLALTLEDKHFDLKHIVTKEHCEGIWQRVKKRSELAGTLLDFLPENKTKELNISFPDRVSSKIWRIKRRFEQDKSAIVSFIFWSSLVAGILFGISTTIITLEANPFSILGKMIGFTILGIVITAIITFVMIVTKLSFLKYPKNETENSKYKTLVNNFVIASCALSFGVFNWLYFLISVEKMKILGGILGVIAGIGLGLGLYVKDSISEDKKIGWIAGLLVTALFFISVQSMFIFVYNDAAERLLWKSLVNN